MDVNDKILNRAAALVWEKGSHPFPVTESEFERLEGVINDGSLVVKSKEKENTTLAFASQKLLAKSLACYAAKKTDGKWEDLDAATQIFERFNRLQYKLKLPDNTWAQLFVELEENYQRSILEWLDSTTGLNPEGHNSAFWSVYRPFCDAIVEINPDPDRLAEVACVVLEEANDGSIHGAVERLASISQSQATSLLKAFTEDPERRSVELAANAIRGLGKLDLAKAYSQSIQLIESNHVPLRQAGLAALGWLNYDDSDDLLEGAVEHLVQACKTNHAEQVAPTVTQSLGTLLKKELPDDLHNKAKDHFLSLASGGSPQTRHVVGKVIQGAVFEGQEQEWMQDALFELSSTPIKHERTLECVDLTISSIAKGDPEWVLKFVRTTVSRRAYLRESPEHSLPNFFSSTVRYLGKEHLELLEKEITQWFASGKPGLQCAAADTFRWFENRSITDSDTLLGLNQAVIGSLDEEELSRAAFAVVGYHLQGKLMASILMSLVWQEETSQDIKDLVTDLLEQVTLYNYPSEAGNYLKELSVRTDTPQHAFSVVKLAVKRSNDYYEALRSRPDLQELTSPERRLRKWKLVHRERSQRMRETVRSESVVEKLVQRVPIKQGKGWFYEQDGEVTEPKGFKEFSSSVPVARSKRIDPLGFSRQGQWFRYKASTEAKDKTFKTDS